jgi:hypothetical protein
MMFPVLPSAPFVADGVQVVGEGHHVPGVLAELLELFAVVHVGGKLIAPCGLAPCEADAAILGETAGGQRRAALARISVTAGLRAWGRRVMRMAVRAAVARPEHSSG